MNSPQNRIKETNIETISNIVDRIGKKVLGKPDLVEKIIKAYKDATKITTVKDIAKKFIPDSFERNVDVATSIISYIIGKKLSEEERELLRYIHWKHSGLLSLKNGTGRYGGTITEKRERGQKGTKAKGQTPWYDLPDRGDFIEGTNIFIPEIAYAYNLRLDNHIYNDIARILNDTYHKNRKIRSGDSVEKKLRSFRNKYLVNRKK